MQASAPALPTFFGMTFDSNGHLLVAEAFGAATSIPAGAAGAVSSFNLSNGGSLTSISSHVGDEGTAACWITVEPSAGKYAYVSNNLSANVSSYSITESGTVTLLSANAATPKGPNDLVAVQDSDASFLYVVASGTGMVSAFQINLTTGSLTAITGSNVFPGYAGGTEFPEGIAAY